MTVQTTDSSITYTGNSITTDFAFPYLFLSNSDLVVVETVIATGVQTTKTIVTDYSVTGAGNPAGGTVVAVSSPEDTVTWTIYRKPPITQLTDFVDNDPLPAATLENAFDHGVMIDQWLYQLLAQSVRVSATESSIASLPPVVQRAGKFLAFAQDGSPIAADPGSPAGLPISTFWESIIDDADLATTLISLGFASDIINVLQSADYAAIRTLLGLTTSDAGTYTGGITLSTGNLLASAGYVNALNGFKKNSTDLPIQRSFDTGPQTITSAGLITTAHGLGTLSTYYLFPRLINQSTEAGWATTDPAIPINLGQPYAYGAMCWADATNIYIRYYSGANVFCIGHKTTGVNTLLTNNKWKFAVTLVTV